MLGNEIIVHDIPLYAVYLIEDHLSLHGLTVRHSSRWAW